MISRTAQDRIGHYLVKQELTLMECLVRAFNLTADEAQRLIAFGAVYLDRHRVEADHPLSPGQYVRVHFDPKRYAIDNIDWRATVVNQTDQFVVVNKPAGIPVHPTLDNGIENVLHQLSVALGGTHRVTQRLDTEVSGLLVVARTQEFQREFNRLLVERRVRKRYRALVTSAPTPARHVHYMERTLRGPKTVVAEARENWLECVLRVVSVTSSATPGVFEVEIDLETGRTHQIRAQLSAMGSPIVGDARYGSQDPYERNGIALFSASTAWTTDDGQELSFELSPPWTR